MIPIAQGKFSQPRGTQSSELAYRKKAGSSNAVKSRPAPAQNNSKPKSSRNSTRKVLLICLCSVALVVLIGVIGCLWYFLGGNPDDGLILNNVTAAGINLGGKTPEEAKQILHQATDSTYTQQNMVIELPDTILELSPADTGAKLDVDAVVEEAYHYGRTGSRDEKEAAQQAVLTGSHPIALLPYLSLDTAYIRSALDTYGENFNSTYAPSSVTLEGDAPVLDAADENFSAGAACQTLIIELGAPGRYVDIDDLYDAVLDAYSFNEFTVKAEMEEAEKLPESIDINALYTQYCSEAVDATMNMETYEVVPEVYGYGFDLEAALTQMEQAQYGDTIKIEFSLIQPAVLGADLEGLLFRDVLASYETKHTNNANRNTNLTLACEAINGYVLDPGETFDYNTVVGQRTAEKGYKAADAYDGGKTVQTLGGGICQVSSTLYYCTLISDLEIVKRSPHSYVSSYMPMGMDATVSWGGPEFSFKNNTNYPIRIEAEVSGGYVKVKLIGTDEKDYYIEMEYEVLHTYSADTVYEEYTASEAAAEGIKNGQIITTPYIGYQVQTYKLKYSKADGQLISREKDQLSTYKKRDKVIATVIPDPTQAPAETTPPATEAPAPEAPAETAPPATEAPAETPQEST